MLSIFKRKTNGRHEEDPAERAQKAQQEQKEQSLERVVDAVQKQTEDFVEQLRRKRVKQMLREALGDNGNS